MRIKGVKNCSQGFTLVEIVVVIILMSLMVTMGYYIFEIVMASYKTTSEQVSAQENHRLVTDYLESEVGHAKSVVLGDDPSITPGAGARLVYLKTEDDGEKVLMEKTASGETMIGYPVDDLFVDFTKKADQPKILQVHYYTYVDGAYDDQFEIDLLLQNTSIQTGLDTGSTILFESY